MVEVDQERSPSREEIGFHSFSHVLSDGRASRATGRSLSFIIARRSPKNRIPDHVVRLPTQFGWLSR